MNQTLVNMTINIMGRPYQIKCPEKEVPALQRAATYLEEKMQKTRCVNAALNLDQMVIITALNVTHEFLLLNHQCDQKIQTLHQALQNLSNKLDTSILLHDIE